MASCCPGFFGISGREATPGAGEVFVAAGSQGLVDSQFMLFANINDPPIANAGVDVTIGISSCAARQARQFPYSRKCSTTRRTSPRRLTLASGCQNQKQWTSYSRANASAFAINSGGVGV